MSGVYHLDIHESVDELKQLLAQQKTASDKERIHALYLLKSEQAQTIQQAAALLGRHRVTVQKWVGRYRSGGLGALLSHKPRCGRPPLIPEWAQLALKKRLEQRDGFESYTAIGEWLETHLGINVPYKTVHAWVHGRWKASPKVVRPQSERQDEARLAIYKKLSGESSDAGHSGRDPPGLEWFSTVFL